MIAQETEDQFRRARDKHECQPIIQPDPAFKDRLGQTANTDPRMNVWISPGSHNPVHGFADLTTLPLRFGPNRLEQFVSDPCPQRGLRCLR